MKKIDFKKELKYLYGPRKNSLEIVDVPAMNFLMVDGIGDPGKAQSYKDALEALFGLAYTLKFMVKKGGMEIDYGVMPLEGLWWADDLSDFVNGNRDNWKWTMMIMQPELITAEMVEEASAALEKKKNPVALPLVRFESYKEGKVGQTLHIGPFTEEGPTIEKLHAFIGESGFQLTGKHHEIYLTDIRRAAPERWRTVLRQQCE